MPRPRTANYTTFFCNNFKCDAIKVIRINSYHSRSGHYCSADCYHKSKKSTVRFIGCCGRCEAEMTKEEQHIYCGNAVALCRNCRESRYATTLASRKKRQRKFVEEFNRFWL